MSRQTSKTADLHNHQPVQVNLILVAIISALSKGHIYTCLFLPLNESSHLMPKNITPIERTTLFCFDKTDYMEEDVPSRSVDALTS